MQGVWALGIQIIILVGILIHAILLVGSVCVLHAQLKAYSEMTKNNHLKKMTEK